MDNKDKDINSNPEVVQTLSGILIAEFARLPPVAKVIGILMILIAFISLLILPFFWCSLSAFLVVMFAIILMAILIYWIGHLFQQRRERDAQINDTCEEIRKTLPELINVNSSEEVLSITLSITKKIIERFMGTVETSAQKSKLKEVTDKLDDYLKTLSSIVVNVAIWKEAEIWLRNNQERLIKRTIGKLLKKYPELKNPGRDLDSDEKVKEFEESICRHVEWILKLLSEKTDRRIPFDESLVIDKRYYREIFENLRDQVKEDKKPSDSAKKTVVGRFEILIKRYG